MDAHADAVARAKAIAARLAGTSAIPAIQPDNAAAADVSAMLDAALNGGGGGSSYAPANATSGNSAYVSVWHQHPRQTTRFLKHPQFGFVGFTI